MPNIPLELIPKYLNQLNLRKIKNPISFLSSLKNYRNVFYVFIDSKNITERGMLLKITRNPRTNHFKFFLLKKGFNIYHNSFEVTSGYFDSYHKRYKTYLIQR